MSRLFQTDRVNGNFSTCFFSLIVTTLVGSSMLIHYLLEERLYFYDLATSLILIFFGWSLSKKYNESRRRIHKKKEQLDTNFKQFYTLIDSIPDFIIFKDGEGKWLEANQMALQLFQLDGISWKGKTSEELASHCMNAKRLIDIGYSENKAWEQKQLYRFEKDFKNIDGTDTYFDIVKVPVFETDDQRRGMVVIGRDITERKRMKEELRAINLELKAIIHSSPLAIISLALDGRVRSWNPAAEKMLGWKQEEIINQPYPLLPEPNELKTLVEESVLKDKNGTEVEVIRKKKDGTLIDVSISIAHLYDLDRHVVGIIAILSDITERKRTLKNLKDIQFALDESAIVSISDHMGRIIYANQKNCEISKYEKGELIGSNHRKLNSNYHSKEFFRGMWETIESGQVWHGEIRNRAKDGSYYWVDTTIVPIRDEQSGHYQYVSIRSNITEKKLVEQKIYQMAYHDPLTDLPNRRLFNKRLMETLDKAQKQKLQFAIMMIDLKRFKVINDTFGHDVGDSLLQQVAQRLSTRIPSDHLIARVGGDEFMLLTSLIHRAEMLHQTADEISRVFQNPFWLQGHEIYVTPTIGISLYPNHGLDLEILTKRADLALYYGKKYFESPYYIYNSDMDIQKLNVQGISSLNMDITTLENELRKAINQNELELYYQPQMNIQTQQLVGMEALIRWHHPELGIISPDDFIPLAEETGLIIPIGKRVLEMACEQNKKWQEEGYPPLKVAVNLSTKQFLQHNLAGMIHDILQKSGLDSQWLELEITESAIMEDTEYAVDVLNQLCMMGIQISIDDFGTGYSSLSYLKKFPINALKIDQSFIRDLPHDQDDRGIVLAILSMAHSLNLDVIAEGIETEDQRQFLLLHGCQQGQGYLFSHPLPVKDATLHLANGRSPSLC
jgi:diguanylate cyclase (GGDEF)-like protein/PAS domain S-box-containing protein